MPSLNYKTVLYTLRVPFWIFVLHSIADFGFGIYQYIPWLDIPMHFIGGVAIALTTGELFGLLRLEKILPKLKPWLEVFFMTMVVNFVAVLWEFAEYLADPFFVHPFQPSIGDTMLDLFLGMIGGVLMAWYLVAKK